MTLARQHGSFEGENRDTKRDMYRAGLLTREVSPFIVQCHIIVIVGGMQASTEMACDKCLMTMYKLRPMQGTVTRLPCEHLSEYRSLAKQNDC